MHPLKIRRKLFTLVFVIVMIMAHLTLLRFQKSIGHEENSLMLDVFTQKEPFSGVGLNKSSDAFAPYEVVKLFAKVTYNGQPLTGVLVTFYVKGPPNSLYNYTFEATRETNENGMAFFTFSIPSLGLEEDIIIGMWTVKAYTEYKDMRANDTLTFRIDWIVKILSVKPVNSTGHYQSVFGIDGEIGVEVTLRNIAKTFKNTTLFVGFFDELNVTFGNRTAPFFIEPDNRTVRVYFKLSIPKGAIPGKAVLYACAFSPNGTAYCPQVTSPVFIYQLEPSSKINIHDVSIVSLKLDKNSVRKDEVLTGQITVRNEGTEAENFTVGLFCDSTIIGEFNVKELEPYKQSIQSLELNISFIETGRHSISAYITPLLNEVETEDNNVTKEFRVYVPYHDLAIVDVKPLLYEATIGEEIPIKLVLKNNGTEEESFKVEIYATSLHTDSRIIGVINVNELTPNETITQVFNWSTYDMVEGVYTLEATIPSVEGEEYIKNNHFIDGEVRLESSPLFFHDLSIEFVSANKHEAIIGEVVNVTVRIRNNGNFNEEYIVVELYVNNTIIGNQTLENIAPSEEKIILFSWNTTSFAQGRYRIKAYIPPLPSEANVENNFYENGEIILLMATSPQEWRLFIILLIIMLLLLLFITLLTFRKRRRRRKLEKEQLVALVKLSFIGNGAAAGI